MDIRQLQQFVTVAETLNFRRAAERLHISQPPLSVSIRKLEAEIGAQLFTRGKDGVKLTKSGEAALTDARRALFHAKQVGEVARASLTGEGGVLRVGFVGSATHYILPRLLTSFRADYPNVRLMLREATSIRILDELEDDSLDIGVVRIPVSSKAACTMLSLQVEPFVLAVPGSHRLASSTTCNLSDLADEEFILYAPGDANGLRMAAEHVCQLRGFSPKVAQEAIQVQTVFSLVEAGLGIALVPAINRRFTSENVAYVTLSDFPPGAMIGISLAWRAGGETSTIRNFTQTAQEVFQ